MKRMAILWALWPGLLAAGEFVPLRGAEISAALTEQTLIYEQARQVFYISGQTLYEAGRPSWGRWQVRGDQYCSQWPPSDAWSCYDMARDGATVRFIAPDGSVTDGAYEE